MPDSDPTFEPDAIQEVVDILLGDRERTGVLLAKDLARIASKRDLNLDQVDAVVQRLAAQGAHIQTDDPPPPEATLNGAGGSQKHALLSQEDEIILARMIQVGLRLEAEVGTASAEIAQLIADARQARRQLIECNQRLVHWVANDYRFSSIDIEDLAQEGMMGLMRAVERFDPERGVRFSTYAIWWIHQAIQRGVDNTGDVIRIPVHRLAELRKLRRTQRLLMAETGRSPSLNRLAAALDWDLEFTAYMLDLSQLRSVTLDAPVADDGQTTLKDMLADNTSPTPEQTAIEADTQRQIEQLLKGLQPREETVLRMRFGVGRDRDYTLEEVGQMFGLTRERIRQIEAKALTRLKHRPGNKILKTLWS